MVAFVNCLLIINLISIKKLMPNSTRTAGMTDYKVEDKISYKTEYDVTFQSSEIRQQIPVER